MCKIVYLLFICLLIENIHAQEVVIHSDLQNEKINFAVNEIKASLLKNSNTPTQKSITKDISITTGKHIVLLEPSNTSILNQLKSYKISLPEALKPEGFAIRITQNKNDTIYWIIGANTIGTMYGGLELAEIITLDGLNSIKEDTQTPFLEKRGIKLNIPLDARTPSYADAGDSAQENISEMWNWDFWTNHLDNLARHRYNTITLWSLHPFPSMVKVPEYPNVALNDIKRSTIDWKKWYPKYENSGATMYNNEAIETLETIKKMTIDEKIVFWKNVMEYAKNRGIEFYIITWNVFVSSAGEHYGITRDMNNATTVDYVRKSVKTMFETYPLLAGIGVTAGEGMEGATIVEKEEWLWNTYGEGLMDAKRADTTNRKYRFIHRYWWSEIPEILEYFKGFDNDVLFDFSFKYSQARLFSNTDPKFADEALKTLPKGMRFWWNLRNDDIYNFRWGDPDYVREFLKNLPPKNQTIGFHMGSDGYAWGREFTSTDPETPHKLEVEKHWLNYLLWGRMGYNSDISNERIEKIIQEKFPQVSGKQLLEIWQKASKIIPEVNRVYRHAWDFQWSVEYCKSKSGFHAITEEKWIPGNSNVAISLKDNAEYVLNNISQFRGKGNKELRHTLGDIEAMAHLGNYYAEKILAADNKLKNKAKAAKHLLKAAAHWRKYSAVASSQYKPQLLGRSGWMDWKEIYPEVLNDISLMGEKEHTILVSATKGGVILEAENAIGMNKALNNKTISNYTGKGYVSLNDNNSWIEWNFDAPEEGEYFLEYRYSLQEEKKDLLISVNTMPVGNINFWTTGGENSWAWDRKVVKLQKGKNTIRLNNTKNPLSIDHLNIFLANK